MPLATLNRAETVTDAISKEIDELFTYQPWNEDQQQAGQEVREALKDAYAAILAHVPSSPTRTRALNCLTDARMLANQAITFNGQV